MRAALLAVWLALPLAGCESYQTATEPHAVDGHSAVWEQHEGETFWRHYPHRQHIGKGPASGVLILKGVGDVFSPVHPGESLDGKILKEAE